MGNRDVIRLKTTGQKIFRLGSFTGIIFTIQKCLYRGSASNGQEVVDTKIYTTFEEAFFELKDNVHSLIQNKIDKTNVAYRPF